MKTQKRVCCFCSGTMYPKHMSETFTSQGVTRTLPVKCFECNQCHEIIYTSDEIKRIDHIMRQTFSSNSR